MAQPLPPFVEQQLLREGGVDVDLTSSRRRFGTKMPATALAISRNPFANARRRLESGAEPRRNKCCDSVARRAGKDYHLPLNPLKLGEKE